MWRWVLISRWFGVDGRILAKNVCHFGTALDEGGVQSPVVEVGHVDHAISANVLVSFLDEHGGDGSDEANRGVHGIPWGEVHVHGDVVRGTAVADGDGAAEKEGGGDGRAVVLDEG